MAKKKPALGRGLDSLLSGNVVSDNNPSNLQKNQEIKLSIDLLKKGQYQPRINFDQTALEELSQSIKKQGIIQPIIVRKLASKKYEIIAGERRWQAAKIADLKEVPVIIRDVDDSQVIAISLIENIQREDLNPIEEANALQRLQDEFDLTQQKVADAVGKSRPQVANLLRLLSLSELIKNMLSKKELEMGHARALLSLDEIDQLSLARRIAQNKLTVRETEKLVKDILNPKEKITNLQDKDPNLKKLENDLEEILGASVNIKTNKEGRGNLIIHYNSLDELDGILKRIK